MRDTRLTVQKAETHYATPSRTSLRISSIGTQPAFPTTRGTNLSRARVGADRVRRQRCQPTRSFEIDSDRFHVLKYRFGGHYRLLAFNFASTVAVGISQRPSAFRAPGIRPAQSFL